MDEQDIAKLPKRAREYIASLQRELNVTRNLLAQIDAPYKSEQTSIYWFHLNDLNNKHPLPPGAHVRFCVTNHYSDRKDEIEIQKSINDELNIISTHSLITFLPRAANWLVANFDPD